MLPVPYRLLITFFLLQLPAWGMSQMLYSKFMSHWEGGDVEYGYGTCQAADGDFIVAGYLGTGNANADACLMKLNSGGAPNWILAFGGASQEDARGVKVSRDGGLFFTGFTNSFGSGQSDVLVARTDLAGNVLWARAIGGAGNDIANAIDTTADGGLIVVGSTNSFGGGNNDFYVLKLDGAGNLQWSRVIGGVGADVAYDVIATRDGGFAIYGQTNSFGAGGYDFYLVKLNAAGNLLYTGVYGGAGQDFGYRMGSTNDDHLLLGGYTNSFGIGSDGLLIKVTLATGAQVWAHNYGSNALDRIFDVFQANDGNYIVTGEGTSNTFGAGDQQVFKTDQSGNLIWARHYGTPVDETGFGQAIPTTDAGIFLVAWDDNSEDILVNKMDSLGDSGCNNAPMTISRGTPTIVKNTGGAISSGGISTNIVLPVGPIFLIEVPYCSQVLDLPNVEFVGEESGPFHRLSWEIQASENLQLTLERSGNGIDFTHLANIAQREGQFDHEASVGNQFYRLRFQLENGEFQFSEIIELGKAHTKDRIQIVFFDGRMMTQDVVGLSENVFTSWKLFDARGIKISEGEFEAFTPHRLTLGAFPKGIYHLRLRQNAIEATLKFSNF